MATHKGPRFARKLDHETGLSFGRSASRQGFSGHNGGNANMETTMATNLLTDKLFWDSFPATVNDKPAMVKAERVTQEAFLLAIKEEVAGSDGVQCFFSAGWTADFLADIDEHGVGWNQLEEVNFPELAATDVVYFIDGIDEEDPDDLDDVTFWVIRFDEAR